MTEILEPITKDDWVMWKHNPVTKRVLYFAQIAKEEAKEELLRNAGINPQRDVYLRGFANGLEAFIDVDIQEETEYD